MSPDASGCFHLEVVSDLVVFILTVSPVPVQGPPGRLIIILIKISPQICLRDRSVLKDAEWSRKLFRCRKFLCQGHVQRQHAARNCNAIPQQLRSQERLSDG
jgi:hypothetical protein